MSQLVMSSVTVPLLIPKTVSRKVRLLRWLVRGYVALEGVAAIIAAGGLVFWLTLLVDWSLEPTVAIRVAIWCVVAAILAGVAYRRLFSRLFVRLTDGNLALLVERVFPDIKQSLVTTIDSARLQAAATATEHELRSLTSRQASQRLAEVSLAQVFNYWPLVWKAVLATALSGSVWAFASVCPQAFHFFLSRARLSPELWPRRVQLLVPAFDDSAERSVNVARDDNYELEVRASLLDDHIAPSQVEIRYRLADGRRGRDTMVKIGSAVPSRDESQLFTYEFKNVSTDLRFDLVGGDDRVRNLQLHVVERPQIVHTAAECTYPRYLNWAPQAIPFNGRVEIPEGSQVVCQVKVNKPLDAVQVRDPETQTDVPVNVDATDSRHFSIEMGSIDADRLLLVDMRDTDGVTNREPYRLLISAQNDELPEVAVQLRGIGSAVTPQARIPVVGSIRDDHGVEDAWIDVLVDRADPQRTALDRISTAGRENEDLGALDLSDAVPGSQVRRIAVSPGQKITLSVKAQDAYDLAEEPHIGSSQRFVLDVVTGSDLQALLEKRELGLRQRFEAIFEKMVATRELLTRIELNPQSEDGHPLAAEALQKIQERDKLRVSGVLQNVTQLTYETGGVAEGFEGIVSELINNRIETAEITERLERGIIEPLREIVREKMPELEIRVQKLPAAIDAAEAATDVQSATIIQADEVIDSMQRVLDRMLELESYNELVDLLRGIVAEQKQLNDQTKQLRREKLRSLLEEE